MQSLSPSSQAELARNIARALLQDTKANMQAQQSPDGQRWAGRKQIAGKRPNRRKMFVRMRLAKHLRIRNKPNKVIVGWVGPAARIGRISQFGLKDPSNFGADYPKRPLIGLTNEQIEMIQDTVTAFIQGDN